MKSASVSRKRGGKPASSLGPARRGKATRVKILRAARKLFVRCGFRNVSLADVARGARLSAGAPYQHFTGKEQMLEELSEDLGQLIAGRIKKASESRDPTLPPEAGLAVLFQALRESLDQEAELFQLFRQAEFAIGRKPHDALAPVMLAIREWLPEGLEEQEADLLAWLLFSLVYFPVVLHSDEAPPPGSDQVLAALASRGLEPASTELPPEQSRQPYRNLAASERAVPEGGGEEADLDLPARVLESAERLMAAGGFEKTTVSRIARDAGVSETALFRYFPGKEALLEELVRRIRMDLAATAREAVQGLQDRLRVEEEALTSFFRFLTSRPGVYRVVREAEFVVPQAGRGYYVDLVAPYSDGLRRGIEAGQIRPLDPKVMAEALMGIGHWAGLLSVVEGRFPPDLALSMSRRFLRGGLAAFSPSGS